MNSSSNVKSPLRPSCRKRVAADELHVIYAIVRGLNGGPAFNHPELAARWKACLVITTDDWASSQLRRKPMLKPKTSRLQFLVGPSAADARASNLTTAADIIRAVSEHFGVSMARIEGPCRAWNIVLPRWCAMSLIKKHTTLAYEKIGLLLNRDHATVIYAVAALRDELQTNPKAADDYAKLESLIAQ